MLEKEYQYFEKIRDSLLKDHLNDYVAIKGEEVIGFYKTIEEALNSLSGKYPLGTFLIQKCISKEDSIQRFYSRVCFAK